MLLSKDVSNNFAKTMFFLRDMIKIVLDRSPVIMVQSVIFMQNIHNIVRSFNK